MTTFIFIIAVAICFLYTRYKRVRNEEVKVTYKQVEMLVFYGLIVAVVLFTVLY